MTDDEATDPPDDAEAGDAPTDDETTDPPDDAEAGDAPTDDEEDADPRRDHIRAVTITGLAAIAGIFSAVMSGILVGDLIAAGELGAAARDIGALAVLVLAIMIQVPLYPALGFEEFGGGKDVLYVGFMTFALWFITFGVILTTRIEFV